MNDTEHVGFSLLMHGRLGSATRTLTGGLAYIVPVAVDYRREQSFREHVVGASRVLKSAIRRQRYRYEDLRSDLCLAPGDSDGFGPILNFQIFDYAFEFAGLRSRPVNLSNAAIVEDMMISFIDRRDGMPLELILEGHPDLYAAEDLARHGQRLLRWVDDLLARSDEPTGRLPLMDAAERHQVVVAFNDTAAEFPRDRTVVEMFAAQAAERPDAVAVVDGGAALSYGALDAASSRLARHLVALGVGPETVVGVCLDRSAGLIVTLLAIWKAGGAYLPLYPEHPEERLAFMLTDASAGIVVTAGALATLSPAPVTNSDRNAPLTPASLAYVIYTSGSTGQPKGVMVGLAELQSLRMAIQADVSLVLDETVLSAAAPVFDVSFQDTVLPLSIGGQLALIDRHRLGEPGYVAGAVARSKASYLELTPTGWRSATADGWRPDACLRAITGAEALDQDLGRTLQQHGAVVWNSYGPTEATITTVTTRIDDCNEKMPRIGAPVANTEVYVVDARQEPVPVGVRGELLIGGVQVSRGYLGRPGLTAEKFIADPFSGRSGARLYRTGDLARWRADGTLEFLGRIDTQVKIRGMRVELGEIEAALAAQEAVAQVVVTAPKDDTGDTRLVAYLVPAGLGDGPLAAALGVATEELSEADRAVPHVVPLEGLLDLERVRAALKRTLPDHMVPAAYVGLSRLPLTPSGKVDRRALPEADFSVVRAAYVAPEDETEWRVAEAMADLLDLERVGRNDGFFDLGGHSLMAARLIARLETPTVATLAAALDLELPPYKPLVRLTMCAPKHLDEDAEAASMIVCFDPGSGHAATYANPEVLDRLASIAAVVAVQARGHEPG